MFDFDIFRHTLKLNIYKFPPIHQHLKSCMPSFVYTCYEYNFECHDCFCRTYKHFRCRTHDQLNPTCFNQLLTMPLSGGIKITRQSSVGEYSHNYWKCGGVAIRWPYMLMLGILIMYTNKSIRTLSATYPWCRSA